MVFRDRMDINSEKYVIDRSLFEKLKRQLKFISLNPLEEFVTAHPGKEEK